ncbi:D-alanyl-D-alanine carboxypeptidase family protein, partial [Vibrio parahaemolyticus VPTS-2010]
QVNRLGSANRRIYSAMVFAFMTPSKLLNREKLSLKFAFGREMLIKLKRSSLKMPISLCLVQ